MSPTLTPGDYIIVTKARALRPGFVVLANHPKYGLIVKRVASITETSIALEGDNPESTSSDNLGDIVRDQIHGRARWAITPNGLITL